MNGLQTGSKLWNHQPGAPSPPEHPVEDGPADIVPLIIFQPQSLSP